MFNKAIGVIVFGCLLFITGLSCSKPKQSLLYHPKMELDSNTSFAVIVFVSDDCPLCKYYRPQIKALDSALTQHPNWKLVTVVEGQQTAKRLPFSQQECFDDGELAKLFEVNVTPYVCVLNADSEKLYEGAWDNYSYDTGKHRGKATVFYLQNALDAIFQNKKQYTHKTEAYGCFIEP